jgi:ribokinase
MGDRPRDLGDGTAVVVVGSVNVDLVMSLPRLPEPGETVIGGRFQRAPGGKGGNQAVAAARLGALTWLVGCIDDSAGRPADRSCTSRRSPCPSATPPAPATGSPRR